MQRSPNECPTRSTRTRLARLTAACAVIKNERVEWQQQKKEREPIEKP